MVQKSWLKTMGYIHRINISTISTLIVLQMLSKANPTEICPGSHGQLLGVVLLQLEHGQMIYIVLVLLNF